MGFRIRILLGMFALIVLALMGTALVAFQFDIEQQEVYNRLRLQRKEAAVERSLDYVLERHLGSWSDGVIAELFSDRICELSDVHGLSISLYNPNGDLVISSIFGAPNDSSTPLFVPQHALDQLLDFHEEQEGVDEDFGDHIMAYWKLTDEEGNVVTIANVRYDKRQMEASGFLAFVRRLAPLYVALFFGAGVLAVLLTNGIVRPLTALRERLSLLELTGTQQPIEYAGKDAIGELVRQYNALVSELELKVSELAQSEREGAWRAMAMQVAHEIKNPLTPFKLGVQQLNRAAQDGREDLKERVTRFTAMAVDQIEVLSTVAEDFSRMASINPDEFIEVNLNDVLSTAALLYAPHGVVFTAPEGKAMVRGTHPHLVRVFNNLLSNAVQAVEARLGQNLEGGVRIWAEPSGQGWLVFVQDDGIGIEPERISRIFEPRFTTKTGGSGLGLSMTKLMVQHFHGDIHVQSEPGVGTTFKVWLPAVLE